MFPFIHVLGRAIPTYGLCMAAAIIVAGGLVLIRGKKRGDTVESLLIIMACAMGAGIVGAKDLYLISSYGLARMADDMRRWDFSYLTDSGLVLYGGLLGGIVGAVIGGLVEGKWPSELCDLIVPVLPLGQALGRVGCLLAGCCYGVSYTGPLAVHSPYVPAEITLFPVQLLEAALDIALSGYLFWYTHQQRRGMRVLYLYGALYAGIRFGVEFLRGDQIRGALGPLSTSQWISVAILSLSLFHLLRKQYAQRSR